MKHTDNLPTANTTQLNAAVLNPTDALDAFALIAGKAKGCRLSAEFLAAVEPCTALLAEKYAFTPMQSVIIAIIIDAGKALCAKQISMHVDIPNAVMMRHERVLAELVKLRVLRKAKECGKSGAEHDTYNLRDDVREAFVADAPLGHRGPKEMSLSSFFSELSTIFEAYDESRMDHDELSERLDNVLEDYDKLSIVQKVKSYGFDPFSNQLMLFFLNRYAEDANAEIASYEISELLDNRGYANTVRRALANGSHPLVKKDVVEFAAAQSMCDTENLVFTLAAKQRFSEELGIDVDNFKRAGGLTLADSIAPKSLFYNDREASELERLTRLISDANFAAVQQRLEEVGMRKGFACLFYGSAGTGKTETVMQLARQTGRDIMQVDLSTVRDKFVGETEKNVKAIFDDYSRATKRLGRAPILLLNEADAIICRRSNHTARAVDKMENAMQNIFLQEIERFEGILIATTNLTENMDSAFSRRFIFKIRFDRPTTTVKAAIWQSVMPRLNESEATALASAYDLSGGQIENVVRKQTIDYVISGEHASLAQMHDYCRAELAGDYTRKQAIGFV